MDLSQARRELARGDRNGWGVGPLYAGVDEAAAARLGTRRSDAKPAAEDDAFQAAARERLQQALSRALGARLLIERVERLPGGAVHAHWAVVARLGKSGARRDVVLRAPHGAQLAISHPPEVEHAVIQAAGEAGVAAPRSYGPVDPPEADGPRLLALQRIAGRADPPSILALDDDAGDRLARQVGGTLARLHALRPAVRPIPPLGSPPEDAARARIAELRAGLDALGAVRPALEWGLVWLAQRADDLPRGPVCLCHRDYRTANFMIEPDGALQAVLDWEFATWSDAAEDIGWLSAVCWRFERRDRACGGFGSMAALLAGYRAAGGAEMTPARLGFWRVYALIRWAVIALQQGARFDPDDPDTLDCGVTPWRLAELETEILRRTPAGGALAQTLEADP
ncbi:MAG: phosphotransferase family protein [Marivibrio sp.]|uniref:phosphotransferase family protein n=1 Tax=Marivibrio sp. TaxID=2039719 RepID=UPI0032ECCD65